jgi:ankyrin repeat protein
LSLFTLAAFNQNLNIVNLLLELKPSFANEKVLGLPPLHCAIERENLELVQTLLDHKADPLAKGNDGSTTRERVNKKNNPQITQLLQPILDAEQEKMNRDEAAKELVDSKLLVCSALLGGRLAHFGRFLTQNPSLINEVFTNDIIEPLLQEARQLGVPATSGLPASFSLAKLAVFLKNFSALKILEEFDAPLDAVDESGTLLHMAVTVGCHDIAKYLLEKGVNPLETNKEGKTPADLVSKNNRQTKLLFKAYTNKSLNKLPSSPSVATAAQEPLKSVEEILDDLEKTEDKSKKAQHNKPPKNPDKKKNSPAQVPLITLKPEVPAQSEQPKKTAQPKKAAAEKKHQQNLKRQQRKEAEREKAEREKEEAIEFAEQVHSFTEKLFQNVKQQIHDEHNLLEIADARTEKIAAFNRARAQAIQHAAPVDQEPYIQLKQEENPQDSAKLLTALLPSGIWIQNDVCSVAQLEQLFIKNIRGGNTDDEFITELFKNVGIPLDRNANPSVLLKKGEWVESRHLVELYATGTIQKSLRVASSETKQDEHFDERESFDNQQAPAPEVIIQEVLVPYPVLVPVPTPTMVVPAPYPAPFPVPVPVGSSHQLSTTRDRPALPDHFNPRLTSSHRNAGNGKKKNKKNGLTQAYF